jgi:hypothetical protein
MDAWGLDQGHRLASLQQKEDRGESVSFPRKSEREREPRSAREVVCRGREAGSVRVKGCLLTKRDRRDGGLDIAY